MANLSNISNKLIVTDGGHLLINQTANNNYRLQMDGPDGTVYAWFKSNVATVGARIGLNSDDFRVYNQEASGNLSFCTAGTERMHVDSSGNVSIGSDDNNGRLVRIAGSGDLLQLTSINDSAAGAQLDLTHERPGGAHDDDNVGIINFTGLDAGSNNTTYGSIRCLATSVSSETGDIAFFNRTDGSNFTEKIRITSAGHIVPGSGNSYNIGAAGTMFNEGFFLELTAFTRIDAGIGSFTGDVSIAKSGAGLFLSSTSGSAATFTIGRSADTSAQIKSGDQHASDLTFSTGGSRRMEISSAGDFGIGVSHDSSVRTFIKGKDTSTNNFQILTRNSADANVFAARNDGTILFGTTSAANTHTYFVLDAGTASSQLNLGTSSTALHTLVNFRDSTNGVTGNVQSNSGGVSFNSISDYRLKENIVPMTGALDRVSQLKPSQYNLKKHKDNTVEGFIAHELQEVYSQAVSGEKDKVNDKGEPQYQFVDNSKLVPLLVGAIQELKTEIEILKNK